MDFDGVERAGWLFSWGCLRDRATCRYSMAFSIHVSFGWCMSNRRSGNIWKAVGRGVVKLTPAALPFGWNCVKVKLFQLQRPHLHQLLQWHPKWGSTCPERIGTARDYKNLPICKHQYWPTLLSTLELRLHQSPKQPFPRPDLFFQKNCLFVRQQSSSTHMPVSALLENVFFYLACKFAILAPASQAKTEPAKKLVLSSDCARKALGKDRESGLPEIVSTEYDSIFLSWIQTHWEAQLNWAGTEYVTCICNNNHQD